jgi:4-hydroxybenzoate polyprenyltransferase
LVLYALILSKFKFIGNFVVAGLIVLAIFLAFFQQKLNVSFQNIGNGFMLIFYGGFAFILNWIREVIKDFEDIEGDRTSKSFQFTHHFGKQIFKINACNHSFRMYDTFCLLKLSIPK